MAPDRPAHRRSGRKKNQNQNLQIRDDSRLEREPGLTGNRDAT